MRALLLTAGVCLAACAPQPQRDAWDMGPMPPVAALYDREAPPATAEELAYYMTADLAAALSAPNTPVDFDWRTRANDPEIENQTFALSEHPPENRADVVTRFAYPQIGGGMILTYTLCRRGPSDWKIEDIRAESALPAAGDETASSLREMLGLSPRAARCQ
jgi:hypothetical protein